MCAETNHGSQEGVVMNTHMGNLTIVRRSADVYAKKHGNIARVSVTAAALQKWMSEAAGNCEAPPLLTYVLSIHIHIHTFTTDRRGRCSWSQSRQREPESVPGELPT